jgi:hypothetical protein
VYLLGLGKICCDGESGDGGWDGFSGPGDDGDFVVVGGEFLGDFGAYVGAGAEDEDYFGGHFGPRKLKEKIIRVVGIIDDFINFWNEIVDICEYWVCIPSSHRVRTAAGGI